MRVLVCGSREWDDTSKLTRRLDQLPANTTILHGGARGADKLAGAWALVEGCNTEIYPADWDEYGKQAGIVRNAWMLDTEPDLVLAFWDGRSRGTKYTIDEARRRGIPVEVIPLEPPA